MHTTSATITPNQSRITLKRKAIANQTELSTAGVDNEASTLPSDKDSDWVNYEDDVSGAALPELNDGQSFKRRKTKTTKVLSHYNLFSCYD
jgi:hypothetical protein